MQRDVLYDLMTWKDDRNRKPLIITGARQCGKTYIMKEFGKAVFESVVYINFAEDKMAAAVFAHDLDVKRIVRELSSLANEKIVPGKTLLILDELQECPRAVAALKYFYENLKKLHVISAGRLIEHALEKAKVAYPAGKVGRLRMKPMSFLEFLFATGNDELVGIINGFQSDRPLARVQLEKLDDLFTTYMIIGGMPEAVDTWIQYHDYDKVDAVLDLMIDLSVDDFSKYASKADAKKLNWIWDSIPNQLIKDNNKFMYSQVKAGKRSHELEGALNWLLESGLIYTNVLSTEVKLPLANSAEPGFFKAYMADVGILRRCSGISSQAIRTNNTLYRHFQGGFHENFAYNELLQYGFHPHFWRSGNTAEIDFLVEKEGKIVPVDVRSAENTMAKSYRLFCNRFKPVLGFKFSRRNIEVTVCERTKTVNLPFSMIWKMASF